MPSIGVYPYSQALWNALTDHLPCITNRSILCEQILEPFLNIKADLDHGANQRICYERYKSISEQFYKSEGYPAPDWEDLLDPQGLGFETFYDHFNDGNSEWELLYDPDLDIIDIACKLPLDTCAVDLCNVILSQIPSCKLLILIADDLSTIYVLRSPDVDNCGPVTYPPTEGFHIYEDIGSALDPGSIQTYVLPHEILETANEYDIEEQEG